MEKYRELAELFASARWVELSHVMENGMPMPGDLSKFYHDLWCSYELGDGCLAYQMVMNEHSGTHVDAPAHMLGKETGKQIFIDENSAKAYSFPCAVIVLPDLPERKWIGRDEIKAWEREHGAIAPGEAVFLYTGQEKLWKIYDPEQRFVKSWPGLSVEAAAYLAEKKIAAVGTDCLSIDSSESAGCPAHHCLLGNNIPIFENLANLTELPDRCFVISLPLRIREGTASPVRVTALC